MLHQIQYGVGTRFAKTTHSNVYLTARNILLAHDIVSTSSTVINTFLKL
jgi:hypothetical protein